MFQDVLDFRKILKLTWVKSERHIRRNIRALIIMEVVSNQFILEPRAPAMLTQYEKLFLLQLVIGLLEIELAFILAILKAFIFHFFKLVHPPRPFLIILSSLFQE